MILYACIKVFIFITYMIQILTQKILFYIYFRYVFKILGIYLIKYND
jgi:hypothetical protein